ncbi:MAG: hypothetical protein R3B72_09590 [Polyangiaceae bacterium]
MTTLERLADLLKSLDRRLDELEPTRQGDGLGGSRASQLRERLDEIHALVDEALQELDEPALEEILHGRCADLGLEVAAHLHLAGDTLGAQRVMVRAAKVAPDGRREDVLAEGQRDPDALVALVHGRWLANQQRHAEATKILDPLAKRRDLPEIAEAAKAVAHAPRPITSAPSLFRVNGIGQALYGHRDDWPDGSYVATLCVSLLFIPVFPIRAYRVVSEGNGWGFMGTVPLSPFARAARWFMVAVVALGIGGGALGAHFDSDEYRLSQAMEEAQALEAGDRAAAIERYQAVIEQFGHMVEVGDAAKSILRLSAAGVPSPAGPAEVDQIGRVVNGFYALPEWVRQEAESDLVDRILAWAEEIGDADVERASARVAVLDMLADLSVARVAEPHAAAVEKLADRLAEERPLMALSHYVSLLPQRAAVADKAQAIIGSFGPGPSLWLASKADVEAWAAVAGSGPSSEAAAEARAALASAEEQQAKDDALAEESDEADLRAALAERPDDQAIAQALALKLRDAGKLPEAIALLEKIAPPGRMTGDTHQVLGILYRDAGRLTDADALLSRYVDERMRPFQRVQRAYAAAMNDVRGRVVQQLEAGNVPASLERELEAATEEERGVILRKYFEEQIAADPQLAALQTQFLRHEAVVPLSMTLGMVKLARVNAASGAERERLLKEAEQSFLAIAGVAEGQPSYHLGLGEVYHRLGRAEEGDAELGSLLERDDPRLTLSIAQIYRNLGKTARSREIVTALYESSAPEEVRFDAAHMLSLLATTLDEQEKWLRASDPKQPHVKASLVELRAQRAREKGDLQAADAAYAEAARMWAAESQHNSVAINNEAVALMARYSTTGDQSQLRNAVARFERSVKLQRSSLSLQNLAATLQLLGLLEVLAPHVHNDTLKLDQSDATSVVAVLLVGEQAEEVRKALASQADIRRALELSKEAQVLAPHQHQGYDLEQQLLIWQQDAEGLKALHDRLANGQKIDITDAVEQRRKFERGELDEQYTRAQEAGIREAEQRLADARAAGHAPTTAMASLLLADLLLAKESLGEAPSFDVALQHYRDAHRLWPNAGTRLELVHALIHVALVAVRADVPAYAKAYDESHRRLDTLVIASRVASGADEAALMAALERHPSMREAVELGAPIADEADSFTLYLAARWLGDEAARSAAASLFDRGVTAWSRRIETLLYPGEEREAARLALYEEAAKAR